MSHTHNTVTNALAEPVADHGISEVDFGGKVKIGGKDPVIASRRYYGKSRAARR